MKIAIACDHGAYDNKEQLKRKLMQEGYEIEDFGCFSADSVDYPKMAYPCAKAVSEGRADRGIVLCGSGIGVSIVANKVRGIRCAHVHDPQSARLTREHNDSNMLAMGGRILSQPQIEEIAEIWLKTPFSNEERHQRRIAMIAQIEEGTFDAE